MIAAAKSGTTATEFLNRLIEIDGLIDKTGGRMTWNPDRPFSLNQIFDDTIDANSFKGEGLAQAVRETVNTVKSLRDSLARLSPGDLSMPQEEWLKGADIFLDQVANYFRGHTPPSGVSVVNAPGAPFDLNWSEIKSSWLLDLMQQDSAINYAREIIPSWEWRLAQDPFTAIGESTEKISGELLANGSQLPPSEWIQQHGKDIHSKIGKLEQELEATLTNLMSQAFSPADKSEITNKARDIRTEFQKVKELFTDPNKQGDLERELTDLKNQQGKFDPNLSTFHAALALTKGQTAYGYFGTFKLLDISASELDELLNGTPSPTAISKTQAAVAQLKSMVSNAKAAEMGKDDINLLVALIESVAPAGEVLTAASIGENLKNLAKKQVDRPIKDFEKYLTNLVSALNPIPDPDRPKSYREYLMLGVKFNAQGESNKELISEFQNAIKNLENPFYQAVLNSPAVKSINPELLKDFDAIQYQKYNSKNIPQGRPIGISSAAPLSANQRVQKLNQIFREAFDVANGAGMADLFARNQALTVGQRQAQIDASQEYTKAEKLRSALNILISGDSLKESKSRFQRMYNQEVKPYKRWWQETKLRFYSVVSTPGYLTFIFKGGKKYGPTLFVGGAITCLLVGSIAVPVAQFGLLIYMVGWVSGPLHNMFANSAREAVELRQEIINARVNSITRIAKDNIKNSMDLLIAHNEFVTETIKLYEPFSKSRQKDFLHFYHAHARSFGFDVVRGVADPDLVRDDTAQKEDYERISLWMAQGWGAISPDQVGGIRNLIEKKVGIPGNFGRLIFGPDAWKLFQDRYGYHGTTEKYRDVMNSPYPRADELSNPLLKVFYGNRVSQEWFQVGNIKHALDENLAIPEATMLGRSATFLFGNVLDTQVKTSIGSYESAIKKGTQLLVDALVLPKETFNEGKTRGGMQAFTRKQMPFVSRLAESYEKRQNKGKVDI